VKLAKVVGTVVLSQCIESFRGRTLHLIDEGLELTGEAEVSATWQAMHEGDTVIVEVAREACNAFDPPLPSDASIIGKVEKVNIEGQI
jgi:microcompartment protein CcmK/EutM